MFSQKERSPARERGEASLEGYAATLFPSCSGILGDLRKKHLDISRRPVYSCIHCFRIKKFHILYLIDIKLLITCPMKQGTFRNDGLRDLLQYHLQYHQLDRL